MPRDFTFGRRLQDELVRLMAEVARVTNEAVRAVAGSQSQERRR